MKLGYFSRDMFCERICTYETRGAHSKLNVIVILHNIPSISLYPV